VHLYLHSFPTRRSSDLGLMSIPSFLLVIITLTDIIRSESPSRTQLLLLAVFLTNVMLLSQLTFLMIAILLLSFGAVILKVRGPRSEEHTSELQSRGHLV